MGELMPGIRLPRLALHDEARGRDTESKPWHPADFVTIQETLLPGL